MLQSMRSQRVGHDLVTKQQQMNSWLKRYIDKIWEDPGCWSFCFHGVGMHHSPGGDVFVNLEALQTPCFWDIKEALSQDMIMSSVFKPSLFSREWGHNFTVICLFDINQS